QRKTVNGPAWSGHKVWTSAVSGPDLPGSVSATKQWRKPREGRDLSGHPISTLAAGGGWLGARSATADVEVAVRIGTESVHHAWDNSLSPVLEIEPGQVVELDLLNSSGGQLGPDSTVADVA